MHIKAFLGLLCFFGVIATIILLLTFFPKVTVGFLAVVALVMLYFTSYSFFEDMEKYKDKS